MGIIGTAFARNLLEDGDTVVGCDIDTARVQTLAAMGGQGVRTPREVAENTDCILIAVASLGALRVIATGPDGLVRSTRRDFVVVDVSTLPLEEKEAARADLHAAGISMLDCTISGIGKQVEIRDVVFMASGDREAMRRVTPVLERLGRAVHDVGVFGNGSRMKFIVNLLVAIHTVSTAEGLVLAERAGLDLNQVMEVINSGLARSGSWEVRGPLMVTHQYEVPGGPIRNWIKDINLIADFVKAAGAVAPLFDQSRTLFEEADRQGLSDWNAVAVHAVLEQMRPPAPTSS